MTINSARMNLSLDLTWLESVEQSQRWVLVCMQDHGAALVTVLWRILGNEQDVCDAYQETFLRLANLPGKMKPDNPKGYLFQTASNIAVSMLRRKKIHLKHQDDLSQKYQQPTSDPVKDFDAKQLQQQLRDAITQLPDHLGKVLILRDIAELTYSQVAQILGIRANAARVYRHKAVKLLSQWMSSSHQD